jgi:protein-disulfide isomerase
LAARKFCQEKPGFQRGKLRRSEHVMMKKMMTAATVLLLSGVTAFAQTNTPAPVQSPAEAEAHPLAQAPQPQSVDPFPPVNLKNFTAASPSREEVNAFLKAMWGYDTNRIWSVAAVLATPAPGVSRVVVFVKDKNQPTKGTTTVFFTTPDGKHAIAGDVIDFGAKPFEATRQLMLEKADGPARGAAGKNLLIVEFADMQCPHCKEFQSTMDSIVQDFPQARVVFENYPISELHPWAVRAAEEGMCVRKEKGDAAFFTYLQAVFAGQTALTPEAGAETLSAAVTKAGGDPTKVDACADTPEIRAAVEAQKQLGESVGVNQTPMLVVNGRVIPASEVPYPVLKQMIVYQGERDGLTVKEQPTLSTLQ